MKNNPQTQLQIKLGYLFHNESLLARALTHRSRGRSNNERLEYLGDSIIGFVIAEALYDKFPAAAEGDLTRMRAHLVRKDTLAELARDLSLEKALLYGDSMTKIPGARDALLANALEAVTGALYLDADLATAKRVLLRAFAARLAGVSPQTTSKDNKTQLQEYLQKRGVALPVYEILSRTGKPHALVFSVQCAVDAVGIRTTAEGGSRRVAEQSAAAKALVLLNAKAKLEAAKETAAKEAKRKEEEKREVEAAVKAGAGTKPGTATGKADVAPVPAATPVPAAKADADAVPAAEATPLPAAKPQAEAAAVG